MITPLPEVPCVTLTTRTVAVTADRCRASGKSAERVVSICAGTRSKKRRPGMRLLLPLSRTVDGPIHFTDSVPRWRTRPGDKGARPETEQAVMGEGNVGGPERGTTTGD